MLFIFPRSFYGQSKVPTVKTLTIPAANVSDDELDTDTVSDKEIISEAEEEILEESWDKSKTQSEIRKLKMKAIRSEKLNLIGKLIVTGQCQLFLSSKKKKLQLNWECTGPLDSGSSPMSFFSLFFNDEFLEDITVQTNVYKAVSANDKGIKPAPPVEIDELKKVFGIILFMGIQKIPDRRLY